MKPREAVTRRDRITVKVRCTMRRMRRRDLSCWMEAVRWVAERKKIANGRILTLSLIESVRYSSVALKLPWYEYGYSFVPGGNDASVAS